MFYERELLEEMPKLQGFAIKLTKTRDDADDLLQATLLKAIEKQHLFEHGTNLFSWTSKIMFNMFVSKYRRRVKYTTQYDPEPYIKRMATPSQQEQKAELTKLNRAMRKLPADHKEILILVCVKDMSYQEAADTIGIPVGTVRSRLHRARENLREVIGGEGVLTEILPSAQENIETRKAA